MLLTYGFTYCIFSDLNCGCLYRDSNYGQCRLPIFDVPSEIQKKVKKNRKKRRSEQRQRCQNETEWMGFVWLSGSVKSLGRTCCRPADQHNDAVIERCPIFQHASQKLHAQRMDRVFTRYWRRAGKMRYKTLHMWSHAQTPQRCTWVLKCLHIHRRARPQQADWEHIVMIGGWRIPLQGVHLIG